MKKWLTSLSITKNYKQKSISLGGSWQNWKQRMGCRRVPERCPHTLREDLPGPTSACLPVRTSVHFYTVALNLRLQMWVPLCNGSLSTVRMKITIMTGVSCGLLGPFTWEQEGGASHFIFCEIDDLFNAICVILRFLRSFCPLCKQCCRPAQDTVSLFREYLVV